MLLVFQQALQSTQKGMSVPARQANCPPSPAQHLASMRIQTPAGNGLILSDLLDQGSAVLHRRMPFSNGRDGASRLWAAADGDSAHPATREIFLFLKKRDKGECKTSGSQKDEL